MIRFGWLLALSMLGLALACSQKEEATPSHSAGVTSSPPSLSTNEPTTPSLTPSVTSIATISATCQRGEKNYSDPATRFTFCYLAEMELVNNENGAVIARYPPGPKNDLVVSIVWQPTHSFENGEACSDSPYLIQNRRLEDFTIDHVVAKACLQDHYDRDKAGNATQLLYQTTEMEVPVKDGFLRISSSTAGQVVEVGGQPVDTIANRTLRSVLISLPYKIGA